MKGFNKVTIALCVSLAIIFSSTGTAAAIFDELPFVLYVDELTANQHPDDPYTYDFAINFYQPHVNYSYCDYQWYFGDGAGTTVSNPTHTYATSGWKYVRLTYIPLSAEVHKNATYFLNTAVA